MFYVAKVTLKYWLLPSPQLVFAAGPHQVTADVTEAVSSPVRHLGSNS